jgi:uncharacterized membrane-anchored protein YhcB (DUF1043 family)
MGIKEKASALREYMTANWNQCDTAFFVGIVVGIVIGLVLAGL